MSSITNSIDSELENKAPVQDANQGFGTFLGVFVPSILMIFGVIIFLRLGWIVGQAGIVTSFLLITFASLIAFLTTLSMASISTNIVVGKGGVYYLVSRSLGIEIGAALGLPLYFKQSLSIAFCVIGFAESLHSLFPILSVTNIGVGTLLTLTVLAYFSLNGALKVQLIIFGLLIASFASLFMGSGDMLATPTPIVQSNFPKLGFWALFAIFFPAMTGIESSVSLSGNLRHPGKSLPLGTILSLAIAYIIYMVIAWFLSIHVSSELLIKDPFIMQVIARVPSLIVVGIWGATISSALGSLLGAPRTLQALAEDGVVPKFFGKNFGQTEEPRIATLTTCVIALIGIYYGSINLIAPLLTMICLICYAVLNFSAGIETLMDNPSWRPRFRIHWSVSLIAGSLCLIVMMMIDPGYSLISLAFVSAIYFISLRRNHQSSWKDIREGILLFFSRFAIYHLAKGESTSKSWRPHFLVFAKESDGSLLQFSQAVNQGKGFFTMASFSTTPIKNEIEKREIQKNLIQKLQQQNIQALIEVSYAEKIYLNMNQMIESYGLGPLKPNTIICGIHKNDDLENLSFVIRKTYQRDCNMIILNSQNDSLESKFSLGDLHVWWHPYHKENGDFMLMIAYMLTRNSFWKKSKICLKVLVDSELDRQKAFNQFQELSQMRRIPMQIEILVAGDPSKDYLKYVSTFSKSASLVFLSLAPPSSDENTPEYQEYLRSMTDFSREFPSVALVLSSKFTPLKDIFA